MRIIALVGPLGSGKSTVGMNLAAFLATQGYTPDQVAIVVNEAGGSTEIVTPHAQIYTLPNGCFTCEDEAVLQDSLRGLSEKGIELVIMEGFGIVSGDETKTFLSKTSHQHAIIGIIDVANWEDNLVSYSELVSTHLTVADAIVATKHIDGGFLPVQIAEFLADHKVAVDVHVAGVTHFPAEVWTAVQTAFEQPLPIKCDSCGGHHHNHDHHGHHHSHGWKTVILDLYEGTSLPTLQAATSVLVADGDMRLKGRLEGQQFNVAPRAANWNVTSAKTPGDLVICYLKDGATWPSALLALVKERPQSARSHQLLRVDVDQAATVAVLSAGIKQIQSWEPHVTQSPSGRFRMITHPEQLQIWKEMARRPGVKADWFAPVITACLAYWVKCAQWLEINADNMDLDHLPTHQRELGVSLAWWTLEFANQLPADLIRQVHSTRPALLVSAGLRETEALRTDSFWRYWQGLEYLRALRYNLADLPELCRADAITTAKRVIAMAHDSAEQSAFTNEFSIKQTIAT